MPVPFQITLQNDIVAIQIESSENGKPQRGPLTRLPEGASITVCGDGFNQRTAKVECNGGSYFVFLRDIDIADSPFDF
jgi:hypothetical protein